MIRFVFVLFFLGCGNGEKRADAGPDADTDVDGDVDSDSDTDSDADTDVDADTDADTDSDTDTNPCRPEDASPPAVVIGAGRTEYSDVACEGLLEIFEGPQGCCHFYGAVRETGVVLDPFTMIGWEVVTDGGETVTEFTDVEILIAPDAWVEIEGGWKANLDHMVIMTLEEPADVTEQALDVTLRVRESGGTEHFDTHRIRVFFDG